MPPQPNMGRIGDTAKLVGSAITSALRDHTPWASELSETVRLKLRNEWLDGLEEHATEVISPLIDQILASASPGDAVAGLLEHAARPTAAFGSTIQQFFVYGVMFSLASTALAPFTQQVGNDLWKANPTRPLSPADLATALTQAVPYGDSQGVEIPQEFYDEAAMSGINAERFATLVGIDGVAPDPTDLFEMFRRGIITSDQLENGFLEGPTKNKWIPFLQKLQYVPATIDAMVRAAIQGQLPYDQAKDLAHSLGLEPAGWINDNPDWFDVLYDIGGRPPGVIELLHLANRGIIPFDGTGPAVTSIEQAVHESDLKTKWYPAIKALATYYPPNSEITTLLEHGWLTHDQAVALWQANGVDPTLAEAYSHMAQTQQITQDKALAKGDIETLIQERIITDDEAKTLLERIGYSGPNADYVVEMAHFRYELEALRSAIRQVSQLYTKRKINATEAQTALIALGLPPDNVTSFLDTLTSERNAVVLTPTAGQITSAAYYDIIDQQTALTALEDLGYGAWDAWLVLSARLHVAAGDEPPRPTNQFAGIGSTPPPATQPTNPPQPLTQGTPMTATVVSSASASFTDQLSVLVNRGAVTWSTTNVPLGLAISSTGAVTTQGMLPPGIYNAVGQMADTTGDQGTWAYSLTVLGG